MKLTLRIALSLAAVAGPFAAANAADYDPPIFVEDAPSTCRSRSDRAGTCAAMSATASTDFGEVNYRTFDPVTSTYGSAAFDTHDLDDEVTWGVGVGYQFSEWIRSDVTVDGFRADFNGTTASAAPCIDPLVDPAFAGTGCRSEDGSERLGRQPHGQRLCRSRHLCRRDALCRRRPRLHPSSAGTG